MSQKPSSLASENVGPFQDEQGGPPGQIVILNGTPRSGKSSIATVIQNTFEGVWMNLGVDRFKQMTPERYQPGIGLRPGGERSDLEVDTSVLSPQECADVIRQRLEAGPSSSAILRLAAISTGEEHEPK